MGDHEGERHDAMPVHTVLIRPFQLGKYAITKRQWDVYRLESPDSSQGSGDTPSHPVREVSWHDVQEFIQWLNHKTGQHFRLPSEAEWEYAARAGTTTRHPWGDNCDPFEANELVSKSGSKLIGVFPENAWGLNSMIAGVWEWTQDCYHENYVGAPTDGSAWIEAGSQRVARGGSWFGPPEYLRVSYRTCADPFHRWAGIGFRLAHDI